MKEDKTAFGDTEYDKLAWAKKRLSHFVSAHRETRISMDEDFKFAAGDQWNENDKLALAEQGRPVFTFNFIKPYIDVIGGLAQQNKTRARAMPVDVTDQFLCDVLNDIAYWVYSRYNIEIDEDDAFENAVISGFGCIGLDVHADTKRFGELAFAIESIYPCEVHEDPSSRKSDYSDGTCVFWEKWISKEDFKIFYPDFADDLDELFESQMGAFDTTTELPLSNTVDLFDTDTEDDSDYKLLNMDFYDRQKGKIRIIHMEYWDVYDKYVGLNPLTGQIEEFDKENIDALKERFPDFEYSKLKDKKIKWLQFIGDKILYDGDSPLPIPNFSLVPIVAYKDKSNGISNYYGVVRLLKDPQKEINKRWSQTLNLLNNQVQGGVYAEVDAFKNREQAEDSMKEAGAITWLEEGAIAKGKFQEKRIPTFPDGPMKMQEFSNQALRFISGINPDLLGQDRGRQEPGVVIRMRQQQGMTVISKLFNNFNMAKKTLFGSILYCVVKFMPDKQILRILGEGDRYAIQNGIIIDKQTQQQTEIRNIRDVEYNLEIQSAPGNMTKVAAELATLTEMAQGGLPIDPKLIISKIDLPADEKAALIQYMEQQQQMQAEMAQREQGLEQAKFEQKAKNEADKLMSRNEFDMRKLAQKQQEASLEQRVERENVIDEVQQKERDSRRKHAVDMAGLEIDQRKLVFDLITQLKANTDRQANAAVR